MYIHVKCRTAIFDLSPFKHAKYETISIHHAILLARQYLSCTGVRALA